MVAVILAFLVGLVCIFIGVSNRKGNISSLHSYHRNRVSEEDRIPFGKKVGLGTIFIGCSIIAFSVCTAIAMLTNHSFLTSIGTVILFVGLIVGLYISFAAMQKYNHGIF